jgi:hypothetical protein
MAGKPHTINLRVPDELLAQLNAALAEARKLKPHASLSDVVRDAAHRGLNPPDPWMTLVALVGYWKGQGASEDEVAKRLDGFARTTYSAPLQNGIYGRE